MRRMFWLLGFCWLAGAFYYWQAFVHLAPEATVQLPAGNIAVGITEDGELATCPQRQPISSEDVADPRERGPMEFWSFPEGKVTRSILTANDFLETVIRDPKTPLVIRRDDRHYIVDRRTGDLIDELPARSRILSAIDVGDGKLAYCDDDTIILRDRSAGKNLWETKGYRRIALRVGPVLQVGKLPEDSTSPKSVRLGEPPWQSVGSAFLNLETGQPDQRFDSLGEVVVILPSPDGQLGLVYAHQGCSVCDLISGARLWTIPESGPGKLEFSPDGKELRTLNPTINGRANDSRWRATDGAELSKPVGIRLGFREQKPGARYAVERIFEAELPWIIRQLNRLIIQSGSSSWVRNPQIANIVDTRSQTVLGSVPYFQSAELMLPNDRGVLIGDGNRLDFYAFPPSRNWTWLCWWGIVPSLTLLGIGMVIGRRRRKLMAESAPAAMSVPSS